MTPKPADLILYLATPKSAFSSRLVAAGELLFKIGHGFEAYSHVSILDEDLRHQFEAKFPKSGRFLIDHSRVYEVWRIGSPSDAQRRRILNWCHEHVGEWYNMIGLLTGGILGLPRTAVCSQFAGYAYDAARIHIGKGGQRLLSPNAIPDFREAKMVGRYGPAGKVAPWT